MKNDDRPDGFYWVKECDGWEIAQFFGGGQSSIGSRGWNVVGRDTPFDDRDFTEIGPMISPPDESPASRNITEDMAIKAYKEALATHPGVHMMVKNRCSMESIIGVMLLENKLLIEKVVKLTEIAPKRYSVDGKMLEWRCPSELIPVTELVEGNE